MIFRIKKSENEIVMQQRKFLGIPDKSCPAESYIAWGGIERMTTRNREIRVILQSHYMFVDFVNIAFVELI